ncbi:MAG: amino acid--tRNA ligase-related protein [Desulfurobacteriaceae bacterium]
MKNLLQIRSNLLKAVREFFDSQGFIEVETPILVPYENPDSNVVNVNANFHDLSGKLHNWFLHTSPEFFMKRVVWHGIPKIYQITKVFRDGEVTNFHNIEFTMVEWYRSNGDYRKGMEETFELLKHCLNTIGKKEICFQGKKVLFNNFISLPVEEAFKEFAGIRNVLDEEEVKAKAEEKDYETAFFKLLVDKVEPALKRFNHPVFLYDYPKSFSAMAKLKGNFAERFELYIAGVELANGYTELVDYESYKIKFLEKGNKAVDKGFLNLLKEKKLSDCEGVALGFDRLVMVILDKTIDEVIPFSTKKLLRELNLPSF